MKKQTFEIKMKDGRSILVEGVIINGKWGIDKRQQEVRRQTKSGEEKVSLSSSFFLTHIPTGCLVTSANTQKSLREFVNRFDVIDEDNPEKLAKALGKFWNERGWIG